MAKQSKRLRRKSQKLEAYHGGVSYSSLTRQKKARTGKREALLPPNCQDENNEEVIREQEGKCLDITSGAYQGSNGDKDGDDDDKSGAKCDGDDMSNGSRNKHDPQCDSNVMSDSHGIQGDARCKGDENRDWDCDGNLAQVDKIRQTPTRNFHALGSLSLTPVFSPLSHHSEEVSPIAPRQLSQEIDAATSISHHDKSSTSAQVDLLLQNPLFRSEVIRQLLSNTSFHQEVVSGLELLKPPIVSHTTYNNQKVNWSECMRSYPVNERAFSVYSRGLRLGQPRHADDKTSEYKECNRAKRRVIDTLLKSGSFEQQRLTLLKVLSDPLVVDITSSIGINMAEISSLREFIVNIKKMFSRSRTTANKNYRTSKAQTCLVNAICVGLSRTPPKDTTDHNSARGLSLSWRGFSRLLGLSVGSGQRIMSLSSKKRRQIADGNRDGWIMMDEDSVRTKYSDELLDSLEIWMENNEMVCHNPCKGEEIIKRDRQGKIVRDETTNRPVRVAKMLLKCNPRILHQHMIETFAEATDGNNVLISESKLRKLLNTSCNHIKQMTERQKMMCGCETCVIVDDIQECLKLFRKKRINKMIRDVNGMRHGRAKTLAESQLAEYISHVCTHASGSELKHNTGWEAAASLLGCNCVEIDGREYIPFPCALQQCHKCENRWDELVPISEANCLDRISYVIFGSHPKCSYHGDEHIVSDGKDHRCELCDHMNDNEKSKLKGGPPRVRTVRLRIMITESMKDFMKQGGTYETYLWKMYHHIAHVKLLGSKFGSRMCYNHWKENDGVIVMELDYSERYQPVPMREIQSENFAKDADVSMEIRIVSYQEKLDGPDSAPTRLVTSYTALSDEKPQIAATTFQNSMLMFEDLRSREGSVYNHAHMVILITDGCSGQYKCGTALYLLAMQALMSGKMFYHFVKCAGHGKCRCDAEGGSHKTFCDTAFDRFVKTPEEERQGRRWAPSHKVEDGKICSLAKIVCEILNDKDHVQGAISHSARKKRNENKLIQDRRFYIRERGTTEFLNLKMQAMEFGKGKHMGLRGYHNFVADPKIPGYVVMARRIPCLCGGCKARMKLHIDLRYKNPCNDCLYYPMYQGLNDWIKVSFRAGKDGDDDKVVMANEWTLQHIGKRMSEMISVGRIGAYLVDDRIKYYLVKWTSPPYIVENDQIETAGGIALRGEWVCNGVWLNDVTRCPRWYWISDREVLIRCQSILCCDIVLHPHHVIENDLPRLNVHYRTEVLSNNPMKLCDDDHDTLMDAASLREGLDYEEEIPEENYNDYESDEDTSSDTESEEE